MDHPPTPLVAFVPPFKVHLCWFSHTGREDTCAKVARQLYEILHRPLQDNAVQRPGIEISVEFGRNIPDLLDALETGREPRVAARLVIAILDARTFASQAERNVIRLRALKRWAHPPPGETLLPIVMGGGWASDFQALGNIKPIAVDSAEDAEQQWRLSIDVCIAAGQALLGTSLTGELYRPRVLLSCTRADGLELRRTLVEQFRDKARIDVWFDDSYAPTGTELARQLQRFNGGGVVLLVRTDRYSESHECAIELLAAKQSRTPIVTLLATVDGEATAPAYSGNHRTMNWRPGRGLEVAARCVQAWLHSHHFRAASIAALALAGLPADSDILPRRPELLDLVGAGRAGRRLVVHPDPPLTDAEAAVLRTAYPAVRIATPTTLLGRVLLAQDPEPPLTGTTLAFSLSVAEDLPQLSDCRVGSGLTQDHLNDTVHSIVLATLRSGAHIAYGGDFRHEGYTRDLVDLHRSYGGLGTRGSAQLMCFLEDGSRPGIDPSSIEFDPIDVKPPDGSSRFPDLHTVLWHLAMREVMAERCTGRILLGGRARPTTLTPEQRMVEPDDGGYLGPWPGFLEEAHRTLQRGRALYVAGGLGGAAALIGQMLQTGEIPALFARRHHEGQPLDRITQRLNTVRRELAQTGTGPDVLLQLDSERYADIEDLAQSVLDRWQRFSIHNDSTAWPNGLDVAENLRLFQTTDRAEITHIVFEGLRRLVLKPEGELQLALYFGNIATVPKVDGYAVTVTPGVPRVGASVALQPHMERVRTTPSPLAQQITLETVGAGDLPGAYMLVAQLALPPIGQSVDAATVERIAREVAQEANRVGLESVACPIFGTSFGLPIGESAEAMVRGFSAGRRHLPIKLVLCEIDRTRYDQLRENLIDRAIELRAGISTPQRRGGPVLHVDVSEPDAAVPARVRVTLYIPDAAQPVAPLHDVPLMSATWEALSRKITLFDDSVQIGRLLWRDVLSQEIRELLIRYRSCPLVIVGDDVSSRLPWELLLDESESLQPRAGGVVRRIALQGAYRTPVDQVERSRLRVLVIADPRCDLPNAVPEAIAVEQALQGRADVIVEHLYQTDATIDAVVHKLERGDFDVLHYAGHAVFDPRDASRGGLLLADGMLSAENLPATSPQLVFLSACESGRLRDVECMPGPAPRSTGRSLAEAFLRAGVRAFVGTFYGVEDASARNFASTVHRQLASGCSLGDAVQTARRELFDERKVDWSNFLLFGDHAMIL